MFDIGWFELFFVVVVAVVVVGPKDLPKMMRNVGRWTGRARAMADQFRRSFDDMARQSELEEMRTEMRKIHDDTSLAEIKRETDQMLGNIPANPLTSPTSTPVAARGNTPSSSLEDKAAVEDEAGVENKAAPASAAPPNEPAPSAASDAVPVPASAKPSAPEPQSPLHRDEP